MNYISKVYLFVKTIPKGKVTTYGRVSLSLSLSTGKKITPRMVGWALHANKDPENVPCHRVVNREGKVASGFAFGGPMEQRRRLLTEGVPFKNEMHVNLDECLHLLK